jgi:endonuclease/exonuclease/phosphatase family metal-dependent hydrolase
MSTPIRDAILLLAAIVFVGSAAQAAETSLRTMSFNLRYATAQDGENNWDQRKDFLLEVIRQFHPDLLGTQEVLAIQADFLAEHLRDYTLLGIGRDDGKRQGEFSAVLFKKERFELVDSGTFWLSETPERPGSKSWDSSLPRVATWARLRDRQAGGRELYFLNTHWDHRGNQARVESAKLIRRWLAEHAATLPIIVTGDLNAAEDNVAYRALVSDEAIGPRLADAFREVQPQSQDDEATFHTFTGKRRGKRIDFILHSPQLKAAEAAIDTSNRDGHYPSDHFPVTAVLVPRP